MTSVSDSGTLSSATLSKHSSACSHESKNGEPSFDRLELKNIRKKKNVVADF